MSPPTYLSRSRRGVVASGALLAALSVALAAYGSHLAAGNAQRCLLLAAALAFGHGVALAALAPLCPRRAGTVALFGLLAGALLFSGSLVAAHFLGTPTRLAPVGGSLLIGAWLLYAVDALRR